MALFSSSANPKLEPLPESPELRPVAGAQSPPSNWRERLTLLVFGTVISLVMLELGYRVFSHEFPSSPSRKDRPQHYFFPEGSVSMRDYVYTAKKPPNTYRIVVVGDSFTFGTGMHFDDTFSKRIERILNLNKGGPKVEVLNYGIPGYSSEQEVLLVKRALHREADLVLTEITLNDPELQPFHVTNPNFDPSGNVRLDRPIFQYWKSLAFIWTRLASSQSHRFYKDYYFKLFNDHENWGRFTRSLKEMKHASAKKGAKFAAVIFPLFSHALDDNYPFLPLHQKIDGMLTEQEIPYLDLYPAYKDIPETRLQIIPGVDSHPNEIGHRIAAEAITRWLERKHIIPQELKIRNHKRTRYGYAPRLLRTEVSDPENLEDPMGDHDS
jgi:hypothetical protein